MVGQRADGHPHPSRPSPPLGGGRSRGPSGWGDRRHTTAPSGPRLEEELRTARWSSPPTRTRHVLPHRPELSPVHRRVDPPRYRGRSRIPELGARIPVLQVSGSRRTGCISIPESVMHGRRDRLAFAGRSHDAQITDHPAACAASGSWSDPRPASSSPPIPGNPQKSLRNLPAPYVTNPLQAPGPAGRSPGEVPDGPTTGCRVSDGRTPEAVDRGPGTPDGPLRRPTLGPGIRPPPRGSSLAPSGLRPLPGLSRLPSDWSGSCPWLGSSTGSTWTSAQPTSLPPSTNGLDIALSPDGSRWLI